MYMAQGFHELGQSASSVQQEYESVSAVDHDFGPLPPADSGLSDDHLVYIPTDAEFMHVLGQLNRSGAPDLTGHPEDDVDAEIEDSPSEFIPAPDIPLEAGPGHSQDVNVTARTELKGGTRTEEKVVECQTVTGTPELSVPAAQLVEEIQIIEVDTDGEQQVEEVHLSADIDIRTDHGDDPVSYAQYEVESVTTGGRTTQVRDYLAMLCRDVHALHRSPTPSLARARLRLQKLNHSVRRRSQRH